MAKMSEMLEGISYELSGVITINKKKLHDKLMEKYNPFLVPKYIDKYIAWIGEEQENFGFELKIGGGKDAFNYDVVNAKELSYLKSMIENGFPFHSYLKINTPYKKDDEILRGKFVKYEESIDESDSGIAKLIKYGYAFTPDEIYEYAQNNGLKAKVIKDDGKLVTLEYTIGGKTWRIVGQSNMEYAKESMGEIIGSIDEAIGSWGMDFGPREFVGPRPDSSVYTKKVTQDIINDAKKVLGKGSMVDSAKLSLSDAEELFKKRNYEYAFLRALRSIKYSVGILSTIYLKYRDYDHSVITKER